MLFDDVAWLGEEYANYAPAARAGIGIFLAKNVWDWWHQASRGAALDSLRTAVPESGVAKWGGDAALLDVAQWVERSLAVDVAGAFIELLDERPWLRLKITRDVWKWPGSALLASQIQSYFAEAMPRERIFFEWPRDRRPRRQKLHRDQYGSLVVTAMSADSDGIARLLTEALPQARWASFANAADVVVASSAKQLTGRPIHTDLAILLKDDAGEAFETLDQIRLRSGARCIVRLAPEGEVADWLRVFGQSWSFGHLIDDAIADANREANAVGEVLASNQTFILQSGMFLKPRNDEPDNFARHRFGMFYDRRIAPEPTVLASPPGPQFMPPVARVLNATVTQGKRVLEHFPSAGAIGIAIDIRPKSPVDQDKLSFPDHLVEWEGASKILQVHLIELNREPITQSLDLPRVGKSDPVLFPYTVVAGHPIDLRFMVCDGVRILQTARLKGQPSGEIDFFLETMASSVEEEKKPFDLALLVNKDLGGKSSATTLTKKGVSVDVLDGSEVNQIRDEMRKLVEPIVTNPDIPIDNAMIQLAGEGRALLRALRRHVSGWPEKVDRVQAMTKSDAFFPLEFLYDGDIPGSKDAKLCPHRKECLTDGKAKDPCSVRDEVTYFCPMGFWGISKTIERQTWDSKIKKPLWIRLPQDASRRNKILFDKIAFSASNRADDFSDEDYPSGHKPVRIADIENQIGKAIPNWKEWKQTVSTLKPSMLVMVAHIQDKYIHIGADEDLLIGSISKMHVGTGSPVAIMIGCNSAIGSVALTSLPSILIAEGAKVVVAALTEVLGRYANEAALFLATRMCEASIGTEPVTIGDLLAELRREFVARDIALGLVLVAFGDADVILGG